MRCSRPLAALICVIPLIGCTESTLIRTNPPGAQLRINNRFVGVTPLVYSLPSSQFRKQSRFAYRVEREGYVTEEGFLRLVPTPGRVVGAVFTLGIVAAFVPFRSFNWRYDIALTAKPGTAAARTRRLQELLERGDLTKEEYEALLREEPTVGSTP
jgi:hypothetical protein